MGWVVYFLLACPKYCEALVFISVKLYERSLEDNIESLFPAVVVKTFDIS